GQQLVPAVPAGVRERPEGTVLAAGEQHAALTHWLGAHAAGAGGLRAAAHAHPATTEEVLPFPPEDGRVHVGGPGQHAAGAEWAQRLLDGGGVKRGRRAR